MPIFGNDRRCDVSVSSASLHDSVYHNSAHKMHLFLQGRGLDRDLDVHSMETTFPTSETAQVAQYLHHKALHGICMRIKGNKQAKKEDVVVAYGAGQFGSTMNGRRAAPVKKLRKHRRYVTVVLVDEHRTSRVCSKHNEEQRARTGLGEDESGGPSSTAETEVREEDDDEGSHRA
ncbi:hypothetical protein V1527DRAFT_451939 [Lipomyces starkeyi]